MIYHYVQTFTILEADPIAPLIKYEYFSLNLVPLKFKVEISSNVHMEVFSFKKNIQNFIKNIFMKVHGSPRVLHFQFLCV